MNVEIHQESVNELEEYSEIPISFEVKSILELQPANREVEGYHFVETFVDPSLKNYDDHETPVDWRGTFDMTNWAVFAAFADSRRVGGAVVAYNTPGVHVVEGSKDLAALWDIRIHPDYRGQGIGTKLFDKAEEFALKMNCLYLKIETQNINVQACKFYQKQGCELGSVNRFAYSTLPDEIAMYWYKKLN